MRGVVLVGRRPDGGRRDVLWKWCRAWWERELGWPIIEGREVGSGPFLMSVASNDAARRAGDWDVCVYTGADMIPGSVEQVRAAITMAESGCLVIAHDWYHSLNELATQAVLTGGKPDPTNAIYSAQNNFSSALDIVPRSLWDQVGGFDQRFVGWGFEDAAWFYACDTLAGHARSPGPIFHLLHPREEVQLADHPDHAHHEAGFQLCERYRLAHGDRDAMLAILREPGGPLA